MISRAASDRLTQRLEGRREVPQCRGFVDDPHSSKVGRALGHRLADLDRVVDVALRVSTPRDRQPHQVERSPALQCRRAGGRTSRCRSRTRVRRRPRTAQRPATGPGTAGARCAAAATARRCRPRAHRSAAPPGCPWRAAPHPDMRSTGSDSADSRGRRPRADPAPEPRGRGRRARRRSGTPR